VIFPTKLISAVQVELFRSLTDAPSEVTIPIMSLDDDAFNEQVEAFERLWPVANTDLTAQGDDWWQNACLTHQNGQWIGYVQGYRKATRLIADYEAYSGQCIDLVILILSCNDQPSIKIAE
jgi:hypothetical protein